MDANRFDNAIRRWGQSSRRHLLGFGGASLVAALFTTETDAKRHGKKGGKKGGKKRRCKGGTTKCDGRCVDLQKDPKHCGKCDEECDPGQQCTLGKCLDTCSPVCTAPEACCGDECTDLTSTAEHCGSCFKACAVNEVCRFANCSCAGRTCPVSGADDTRCCPSANGNCCEGGKCCPNNGVCATGGLCCDAGYYQCPGTDVCCQVGLICSGFECLFPERAGAVDAQRAVPAVKATRAL